MRTLAAALVIAAGIAGCSSAPAASFSQGNRHASRPANLHAKRGSTAVASHFKFGPLGDMAASSPSDVWAVGSDQGIKAVLVNWNGNAWQNLPAPAGVPQLSSVAAVSPSDAWTAAVTSAHVSQIFHWDGQSWAAGPSLGAGPQVHLAAVAADDAWAVGGTPSGQPLILHWNGQSWARVASPAPAAGDYLTGVAATSSDDAWAIGTGAKANTGFIEHWDGKAWKLMSQGPPGATLTGIAVLNAGDAWAVGSVQPGKALIMRWNGQSWSQVPVPAVPGGADLDSVAVAAPDEALAVGSTSAGRPVSMRWNGQAWLQVPVSISAVSTMPAANTAGLVSAAAAGGSVWAAGTRGFGGGGVVLRWDGTSWQQQ